MPASPAPATALRIWEWRGFWPGHCDIFSRLPALYKQKFSVSEARQEKDVYFVMKGTRHNIKCRGSQLEIKRLATDSGACKAFYEKEYFAFPIAHENLSAFFPHAPRPHAAAENPDMLHDCLQWFDPTVRQVLVTKERRKIELSNQVQIEHSMLLVEGKRYASFCVEGLDYHDVSSTAALFCSDDVIEEDYTGFLLRTLA